jgi:hypothetical protein
MKMLVLLLVAIMAISAPAFAAINLVANGEFDNGYYADITANPPGSLTDWTKFVKVMNGTDVYSVTNYGPLGSYTKGITVTPYSGASAAVIKLKGGDSSGVFFGITQTVSTIVGHNYTVSAWIYNWTDTLVKSSSTMWGYECFAGPGAFTTKPDSSGAWAKGQSDNMSDTGNTGGWKHLTKDFRAGDTSYSVAFLGFANCTTGSGGSECLRVDKVEIFDTYVPEPGSMLALGAGLLGFAGFIRRKR